MGNLLKEMHVSLGISEFSLTTRIFGGVADIFLTDRLCQLRWLDFDLLNELDY
jgi:hypothetical protein